MANLSSTYMGLPIRNPLVVSASNLTANKEILKTALIEAVTNQEASIYKKDAFGVHYDVKFYLKTNKGESWILSSWIIRNGENFPRLTNVYPINK